jgi:hypothetical protein
MSDGVVLVEGESDRNAVEAVLRGSDLVAEVLVLKGATNIGRALRELAGQGRLGRAHGLYDEAEVRFFQQALQRNGFGEDLSVDDLAVLGFHRCRADLEDELIRALGVDAVIDILGRHGDLGAFRTFQQQPAQAGKPDSARLRRFLGAGSGRKIRYGRLLAEALAPTAVPEPLQRLMSDLIRR